MTEMEMPSAVVPPEASPDYTASPLNSLKRQRSTEGEEQHENEVGESKRQKVNGSNGEASSPPIETNENGVADVPGQTEQHAPQTASSDAVGAVQTRQPTRDRRKANTTDEKQRSKRLFGALLGNLNQPSDAKQSSRRAEIEARRKSEIKKQDEESLARDAKERERRLEWRRRRQSAVEEDEIKVRHRNLLERARFLVTEAEPKLYYKPWELRADEEERIEEQIKEAEEVVESEVEEWKIRTGRNGANGSVEGDKGAGVIVESSNGDGHAGTDSVGGPVQEQDGVNGDGVHGLPTDEDAVQHVDELPDEVPDSEDRGAADVRVEHDGATTMDDEHATALSHEEGHEDLPDGDDGEETVIY